MSANRQTVRAKRSTLLLTFVSGTGTWENGLWAKLSHASNSAFTLRITRYVRIRPWSASRKSVKKTVPGDYEIEVVDIAKFPDVAKDRQIVATPAVFRTLPAPLRKCIGDLSQNDKALLGLDLFTPLKSRQPKGKSARRTRVPQAAD